MEKKIRLTKIPLAAFIAALEEVWESGADFIDIIAVPNVDQDCIGIIVRDEYISMEEEGEEEKKIIKITEDDISKLLD